MLEKLEKTRKSPVHNRFLKFLQSGFRNAGKHFSKTCFTVFRVVFHNRAHLARDRAAERAATAPRQFSAVGKLVVFRSIFHSWRIRRELKPIYSVENISEPTSSVFSPESAVFFRECFMNCVKRGFTSDFATLYLYGYSLRNTCCNNVKGSRNEAHLSAE